MHLNFLKGAYGTIRQIDKSLPVKSGEVGIERGSLLLVEGAEFRNAVAGDTDMAYLSLHGQNEPDVQMTGVLTALPVNVTSGEVETDMFDGALAIGDKLTIGAGKVIKLTNAATEVEVGTVTKAPAMRWVNNYRKPGAMRTGGRVSVIQFTPKFEKATGA